MPEPRALAMEWIRAYNEHDVDGFRALMAPNYRHERNGVVREGADNFIEHIKRDWTTWPPCRWTVTGTTDDRGEIEVRLPLSGRFRTYMPMKVLRGARSPACSYRLFAFRPKRIDW